MRRIPWSLVPAGLAAALVAAGLGVPAAAARPVQPPAAAGEPAVTATRLVTLLSGDVIAVDDLSDGTRRGSVVRDTGPQGVAVNSIDGRVSAIPHEAMPLVVAGRLDLGLFDVTGLLDAGLGDAAAATVPLVVTADRARRSVPPALPAPASVRRDFPRLGAQAVTVGKDAAATFWSRLAGTTVALPAGVQRVWLDRKVSVTLDESVPSIGAPQLWADGYDGEGVTVAVLDTGMDTTHPDLVGKVVKSKDFAFSGDPGDRHGHGTHVASTVAGSGAASGGSRKGVAPGVELLNGKVLADWGSGQTSWIMAGMEWAVAEGADVVNLSLGACCGDGTDVLSMLVDELSAASDTLFVIAAGNDGPGRGTIGMPGTAARALTVGATGRTDDTVAEFSSRGPDRAFRLKPDLTAPGVGIVAARAAGTEIGTPVDDRYTALNGTSMATPHVAGAAALLRQRHPEWTAAQVKDALVSTASRGDTDVYSQGGGRLDVARAARQHLRASAAADFGGLEGPFEPGRTETRTITYSNSSAEPLTVGLTVDAKRLDDGTPTQAATVSPERLTVPAGGTATATVTLRLGTAGLATYGGWVVARSTDGEQLAHTNLGWTERPDHARLTMRVIDREGGPVPGGVAWLVDLSAGVGYAGTIVNGQVQYYGLGVNPRLPVGRYMFLASYLVRGRDGRPVDPVEAVLPDLNLDDDRTFVVDSAQTRQVRFATPRPTGELGMYRITAERSYGGHVYRAGTALDGIDLVTNQAPYLTPTEPVAEGGFEVTMYGRLLGPPLTAQQLDPPGRALEPQYLWCLNNHDCFPRFDGSLDLPLADAGTGSAAELTAERVRGRIAVVNPDTALSGEDVATRAEAAGARGVVFWEDEGFGVSSVRALTVGIPLMRVTASEGAWLAGRSGQRFRFAGKHPAPYAYDVAVTERDRVPAELSYRPDLSDHATVRRELRHRTTTPDCEHWSALPSWLSGACRPTPHAFTHYVLPGLRYVTLTGSSWGADVYRPGQRVEEKFNAGPLAPGAVESELFGVPASTRAGNTIRFSPGEALREQDPTRHNRIFSPLIDERLTVARDGVRIADEAAREATVAVAPGDATYQVSYDAAVLVPGVNRTSRSHTEWTFRSGAGPTVLPQLQVGYDVPLDLYNRAPAGQPLRIGIGIHRPAGSAPAAASRASLDVSYDGGSTWQPVRLSRSGDQWYGVVRHPRLDRTDGYVSLRVRGADAGGGTVDQTLHQAYALR